MREKLVQLVAHMRWADARTLDAIRSADAASVERAIAIYAHVLGSEHVWLTRLEGRPATVAVWPVMTLDECAALADASASAFERLAANMTNEELERMTSYTNSAGASFTSRVDDILLHVLMHGSYHRGQVSLLLRGAGAVPTATDYIAFVRGAPAATIVAAEASQSGNGSAR